MRLLELVRDFICPVSVATLVFAIPIGAASVGFMEVFVPGAGAAFAKVASEWFKSIPSEYYTLSGAGLTAYIARRGYVAVKGPQGEMEDVK